MGPELWVAIAAVFVSGGAVGAAGTLLTQWVFRKIGSEAPDAPPGAALGHREAEILRMEVADLSRRVLNMDARLEFQEQLLDGSLHMPAPPPRFPSTRREADGEPGESGDGDSTSDRDG
ncbi:MAG TPA: hypothetical protein VK849_12595 [Longimicrobiales bacterium]|nr:hypothetical protein [Longimicrobiales bacterium]